MTDSTCTFVGCMVLHMTPGLPAAQRAGLAVYFMAATVAWFTLWERK